MNKKHIFITALIKEIRVMKPKTLLYKALKTELSLLGYWHNKPRGNPAKGYAVRMGQHIE